MVPSWDHDSQRVTLPNFYIIKKFNKTYNLPDKMGFFDKFLKKKKRKQKKQKSSSSGADYFVESNKDGNLF